MASRMDTMGRLIAAGRALVEVDREDFAKATGLSLDALALRGAGHLLQHAGQSAT